METGTGKTYVYLRTIFELSRRYGLQKFIIVVPSVAIREGVLKNIEITAEHFRALYNNLPFEHFVYDAKKVNRLRQFAVSNTVQILVINIDAFRKNFTGTEAEQKSNVIYKESDKLSGRQPIEFVQATRPIVIIDEPQSVDATEKAQEAIRTLNPLCTLRYSATHRNPYNLIYRLDPVRAFELRLVKQIIVASAAADEGSNDAFVRVEQIDYKKGIKARLRIREQRPDGPKEKSVTVKNGTDLFSVSNETRSAMKKRQEIGRGLRLPVNQMGQRVFDESVNKLFVIANESYEDFARALQTEYEEDCGVTFGKVPITALARITHVVDGEEKPIGRETAEIIKAALVQQKMLDTEGRIQPAFDPKRKDFKLDLPEAQKELVPAVVDLLASYQIERHIRQDKDEGVNRLKKEVTLSPEFTALGTVKLKTTYRVEFETDVLVRRAVEAIKRMERIEAPKIRVSAGQLDVRRSEITTQSMSMAGEQVSTDRHPVPDVLAYLQNETELTRSTLVRILKDSGRLAEFFHDPKRFMDAVVHILKYELHRLLVDGIKYEIIGGGGPETEWEMMLFKNEELINYLTALQVNHSIYEYVVYESEVEREFAKRLDQCEDIKLFVKLPGWFEIDTPVGKYNPDWAVIMKQDNQTLYLVRETKSTKDFLKLRTSEADKVRCGKKHFETLDVPFEVVVSADEV
jgi:restriction endonuclease